LNIQCRQEFKYLTFRQLQKISTGGHSEAIFHCNKYLLTPEWISVLLKLGTVKCVSVWKRIEAKSISIRLIAAYKLWILYHNGNTSLLCTWLYYCIVGYWDIFQLKYIKLFRGSHRMYSYRSDRANTNWLGSRLNNNNNVRYSKS